MFKFLEALEKYKNECAFAFLDGENKVEVSFEKYYSDVKKCAYNMESIMGPLDGKHVAVIGLNSYEYVVVICALMFSRAVLIPLNFRETQDNLEFAVNHAEVEYLISDASKDYDFGSHVKNLKYADILGGENEKELTDFTEEEADKLFMIVFTSGTTSLSKGVALSIGNIFKEEKIALPEKYSHGFKAVPGFRVYTNFPFYHIGGLLAWVTWAEHGCTMVQSVNPMNVLEDLLHQEIDYAGVIPATVKLWLKQIRRGNMDRLGNVKIITTAGAPVSVDDVKEIQSHGIAFGQYYGMTECGGNITFNFDMENHIASVGRCYDDGSVEIIDGEICARYWGNMMGYYKDEEETAKVLKDGLVYTGDLGYVDDEGYVFITGRKKNLIILSGGENVSPEELERYLQKNENVKECLVYEDNDRIAAGIFCDEACQEEIQTYVNELNKTLPIYKRIYKIEFQNHEFEKTALGKLKR